MGLFDPIWKTNRYRREKMAVADGTVRNGELAAPAGHILSFCAAGFNDAWVQMKS